MTARLTPADRPLGWTAAAGVALAALLLSGCSTEEAPAGSAVLPSTPLCESGQTPASCLDGVRLALQSAFADTAQRGEVTHADHERIVASVLSADRLGDAFSYRRLTSTGEGVDDDDRAEPTQVRVVVSGASGTWWICPQQGRVEIEACR